MFDPEDSSETGSTELMLEDPCEGAQATAVEITHDAEEKDAAVRSVKVSTERNMLSMRIFLDVSSCEVFLNGGERTMTGNVYSDGDGITFFAEGGAAKLVSLDKYDIVV